VDVDDAAVQKMVEESVEHAFEDMRARLWVEAKLRAQETLVATRKGLAECQAEITAEYAAQVEQGIQQVEAVLLTEDPVLGFGDPAKLKESVRQLDELTRDLAEVMMDRAMEAMLRKRGLI